VYIYETLDATTRNYNQKETQCRKKTNTKTGAYTQEEKGVFLFSKD
jgi:hypothetical protein